MNFSYDELVRLENEAMRRVKQINESERNTAKHINEKLSRNNKAEEIPKAKHTPMPANISKPQNPFSPSGLMNSDSALLMAVILLLGRENTDTILLLALVYVLM